MKKKSLFMRASRNYFVYDDEQTADSGKKMMENDGKFH
jgi:hypothetical protein